MGSRMFWRIAGIALLCVFAFGILFISILRSAEIRYSFSQAPEITSRVPKEEHIEYQLPSAGKVLPDNPLWFIQIGRDRIWYTLTPSGLKKAELDLLFSDMRLLATKELFKKEKYELGVVILLKAEKYLEEASFKEEEARHGGVDTRDFLIRMTMSSLKHREVIEELLVLAPADARPEIVKIKNITKDVFVRGRNALQETGKEIPKSPSEWD